MANSKITIVFNSVPAYGKTLQFAQQNALYSNSYTENFYSARLGPNMVQIPSYTVDEVTGEPVYSGFAPDFFKQAFDLDYNTSGLFVVESIRGPVNSAIGTVIITAAFPNAVFKDVFTDADVTITIENQAAVPPFNITNINFSSGTTNQCQNVKVNVTANHLATKVISPVLINPNTNNPFSFDWLRSQTFNVIVEDSNGLQATQSVTTPRFLTTSNFSVTANNSPNGGTAIINSSGLSGLTLQYSLDNVNFQSQNVFPGLPVGDYTAYIRDQLGCSVSLPFKLDEFNITEPYFEISKSNSFRFAERVVWDYVNVFKTDENTLSCEANVDFPWLEVQEWKKEDVITTQFKSNYASNIVKTIDSSGIERNITVYKKSNNIGLQDKRDAIKTNLGGGKTGIYFISGNTYDYATNAATGSYILSGGVPEWGRIGNYVQIDSAWFKIERIIYDEVRSVDLLVISNVYTGVDAPIIVASVYNRENYEVYEFIVNMIDYMDYDDYMNSYFRTKITATNDIFPTRSFLSEKTVVLENFDKFLEIRYWNNSNTDINYSTGIEHLIRIPFNKFQGRFDEDSETYKTDSASILLTAQMFEVDEVILEPNTKEIWRKISMALSHENVYLNGVSYVKNNEFSTEGPLEASNLYVLTAAMVKTGTVYNSRSSNSFEYSGPSIDVPNLIKTDAGYLEY